jgi:RimJ/RimL family protein N-acetyltransferase
MIPTFDTARLTFHGHRLGDFDDSLAMWSDPEVTRYIGGKPRTGEEVWMRLLRNVGHWSVLGFGYWVMREKASGRFVGEVGFSEFKRDIGEPSLLAGMPEGGWVLQPWAHGQGFATEALGAALGWLGARRTCCIISPDNRASIRLAEKHGYQEVARTTYHGDPSVVFHRP